ncbi:MAG TPA: hypothetical protein VMH32_13435 [Burkholderiales bacterium]|nr:hypothetical protein [Burkholderiales bacterium]
MPKLIALTTAILLSLSFGCAMAEDEPPAAEPAAASDASPPAATESTDAAPMESADVTPQSTDAAPSDSDSNK